MPAFVYVIAIKTRPDIVKIGVAGDVKRRLCSLQGASPDPLEVVFKIYFPNERKAFFTERESHHILGTRRMRGEWFSATIEDAIAAVRRAASFRLEKKPVWQRRINTFAPPIVEVA